MTRPDGRKNDELRPVTLTPDYVIFPEGSVLLEMGQTKVLCNVTIEKGVPRWMQLQQRPGGWITAEYALLPRSTQVRSQRETHGLGGRTQEIRRMIGRSLRASVDLEQLGEHTLIVDCDVIQADGGTRSAAITGGYVALRLALQKLVDSGVLSSDIFLPPVAAVSVGILDQQPLLDLCYAEDAVADVDVNVVMNARGEFIDIQGTAEGSPFKRNLFDDLLNLAEKGIKELLQHQQKI